MTRLLREPSNESQAISKQLSQEQCAREELARDQEAIHDVVRILQREKDLGVVEAAACKQMLRSTWEKQCDFKASRDKIRQADHGLRRIPPPYTYSF